jgi:hypothetical protein
MHTITHNQTPLKQIKLATIKYKYNKETGIDYCNLIFKLTTEKLVTPEDYHRLLAIIYEEIQKLETIKQ